MNKVNTINCDESLKMDDTTDSHYCPPTAGEVTSYITGILRNWNYEREMGFHQSYDAALLEIAYCKSRDINRDEVDPEDFNRFIESTLEHKNGHIYGELFQMTWRHKKCI